MKPNPHTVSEALRIVAALPEDAVLIGDSVSDIDVARRTGVHSIGYAKTEQRGAELRSAGADAVTYMMGELIPLSQ
jgi:phosphoglycolate phosphatase-like HAD superfamily hydrolase